jgi:hypothetical protein
MKRIVSVAGGLLVLAVVAALVVPVSAQTSPTGCTLTQGYWKTHSRYGPAPYDDTWSIVGEDTPFYLSGQSWYQVLWTPPAGGQAYYILAHAYIATRLNLYNGASPTPEVLMALADTEVFFVTYTPAQAAGLSKTMRARYLALATTLTEYNEGLFGPGHCSE